MVRRLVSPAHGLLIAALAGLLVTCVPAAGWAQDTREEQLAAEQAEKATQLHAYVPTSVERRIEALDQLVNPPKFFPFIGSIFPGGLLAAGPRFRTTYGDSGVFDAHAAWSLKNYKLADVSLQLPSVADNRVRVEMRANWLDAPDVAFYGLGNQSRQSDPVSFLYRTTTAGISARIEPVPFFAVGGGVDYFHVETRSGAGDIPIEAAFTPADTAGLGASPTYARSRLFAEVDWRESPGYTRRGGFYRLDWTDYRETQGGAFGFRRLDAEASQFFPILRNNWVIAVRALVSTTDADAGSAVPYFLMPDLGGSSDLRGYPSWRFRDRNRMLLTGEYRWMAGEFVDMALFLDAGKVAPQRSDLNFDDLKKSYGIGIRFHAPTATVLRFEVARTSTEGIGLLLAFGQTF
jgi:hypothetical protein